jgi:hypothetical protein
MVGLRGENLISWFGFITDVLEQASELKPIVLPAE